MFKTKDGYVIEVGMWLSDYMGTYEVEDIDSQFVYLREIDIADTGDYRYCDSRRRLTEREVRQLSYN